MAGGSRNNTNLTIQASANSTDTTSMWFTNEGHRGGIFTFRTTVTSSSTILPTWTVQGKVGNTTKAYNVAALATTSTSSVVTLVIYPGLSTAAGGFNPAGAGGSTGKTDVVSALLPFQFRVRSTNVGSGTVTWAGWVDLLQ